MFGAVAVAVALVSEIEAMPPAGVLQQCRDIDEKYGLARREASRSHTKNL